MTDIASLVTLLIDRDAIAARSWVLAAERTRLDWSRVEDPVELPPRERGVAAAIVELMAERRGVSAPRWTAQVGALTEPLFLVEPTAVTIRMLAAFERDSPEALRKRRIYAPKAFLTSA